MMRRREFLIGGAAVCAAALGGTRLAGAENRVLNVAYAGSMSSMMEGPIKSAVASALHLEMRGRAQGSSALAQLIVGGNLHPDVFLPVTPGPMQLVLKAGKAHSALPIARTEMVIAYSPRSRFAARFDAAAKGRDQWWRILQEPGFRFGRTDPVTDPQGRNIFFAMMLAAKIYKAPDLVEKTLGPIINEKQIFTEPSVQARLQSGELDAASAYKIQPGPFNIPYISLPAEVNLSSQDIHANHPELSLSIGGKTYFPEPLIYFAAALTDAPSPSAAAAFVQWLKSAESQSIFRRFNYDAAGDATPLSR
jgi:molybdate/tungstate transport system substrate-binding protein